MEHRHRPGYGSRHPAVAELLAAHRPAVTHGTAWARQTIPIRISAYLGAAELPDELVVSVRCLVRVGAGIVVCENPDATHPWPGGRREPGESYADTAAREVHEETGWLVERASIRRLGWLHLEMLNPAPAGHPYPHPDFLQIVLVATATSRDGGDPTANWVDIDGYEQHSTVLPLETARQRVTEPPALPFLDLLETTTD